MNNIAGIIISVSLFIIIYRIIELFARRKERLSIIDKIESFKEVGTIGICNWLPERQSKFRYLPVSLLMLGLGLGLLISVFLIYNMPELDYKFKELIYSANMLIFGGLALLISYFIENQNQKMNK